MTEMNVGGAFPKRITRGKKKGGKRIRGGEIQEKPGHIAKTRKKT